MPWTPTFFLIASAVLLLAFAPTQLDSADRDTTQQVERTRPYKRPALIQPRENDIVIRRGESRLELYRVVTRVGGVDGTETFTPTGGRHVRVWWDWQLAP